ncbi:hypothetical protein AX17_004156 [Amanita inopinata Kibby_2008]|nr:hypothetical protein AX17_004156 [Amanita inopinata Kibby_2008]
MSFGGLLRKSLLAVHHGIISVCAARGLARLVTVFIKHAVGRLRPDFLSRCKWDDALKICAGRPNIILSGRKSFPSGHSSTAFSGMTVLSLWIAGQTAAWCLGVPSSTTPIRSRLASFSLTLPPLFWAAFVAISRLEDNRHHVEDVVVGSIIGVVVSIICYHIFWESPFSAKSFRRQDFWQPRLLYSDGEWDVDQGAGAFELTALEEDNAENV